jgi:predicted small lipoprotein YifL
MHRYISFALISVLLFGCGQKGPLYLPKKEPVQHEQPETNE